MANTIKIKRSAVPGKTPIVDDLELGELAINTYDGKIFLKKQVGVVSTIISVGDTGYTGSQGDVGYTGSASTIVGYTGSRGDVGYTGSQGGYAEVRDYETYIYTIASSQSTFTGLDDNGKTLDYSVGKVEVYLNGVRLVDNYDYTATNGTSIVLAVAISSGTLEVVSLATTVFAQQIDALTPGSVSFTNTSSNQVADMFLAGVYRTAKYLIQMSTSTDFHATEVLLIHDGTTVYISEYNIVYTDASLGTVSADISGGYVRLVITPANNNTTVKFQRLTMAV